MNTMLAISLLIVLTCAAPSDLGKTVTQKDLESKSSTSDILVWADGTASSPLPGLYQDNIQKEAVKSIESTNYLVGFTYNTRLYGQPVVKVSLLDTKINDSFMVYIKPLLHLRTVKIKNCEYFTGTGLTELENLPELRELQIIYSGITDDGLKGIRGLKQLETLQLVSDTTTDAVFKHIKELTKLKTLDADISDEGILQIKTLTNLESLTIDGINNVTDKGIEHLKDLQKLKYLYVSSKSLTNAGIKYFQDMKQLRYLDISYSKLDDSSIDDLRKLTQLETLCIIHSKISKEGMETLRKKLPTTKVLDSYKNN
jgi:Leucine-rich repeat (LRR) protein